MKKNIIYLIIAVAAMSCQDTQSLDNAPIVSSRNIIVSAGIEGAPTSKVAYTNEDGKLKTNWEDADQIAAWSSDAPSREFSIFSETSIESGATSANALFSGNIAGLKVRFLYPSSLATIGSNMSLADVNLASQDIDTSNPYMFLNQYTLMSSDEEQIVDGGIESMYMKQMGSIANFKLTFINVDAEYELHNARIEGLKPNYSFALDSGEITIDESNNSIALNITNKPTLGVEINLPVAVAAQTLVEGSSVTLTINYKERNTNSMQTLMVEKTLLADYNLERAKYHNMPIEFDMNHSIAPASVTVKFNKNFFGDNAEQSVEVATEDVISADMPTQISVEGCVSPVWYTEAECTNAYDFSLAVSESVTLYADWKAQDASGNLYDIAKLGDSYWIASNLKSDKYADGSDILLSMNPGTWKGATSAAYSWPSEDLLWEQGALPESLNARVKRVGYLYNWYAASSDKNICPAGWHIPTKSEFETSISGLGSPVTYHLATDETGAWVASNANQQWVSKNWGCPAFDSEMNNTAGFNLYPSSSKMENGWWPWVADDEPFTKEARKDETHLWFSSEADGLGEKVQVNAQDNWLNYGTAPARWGFPVRCIRD